MTLTHKTSVVAGRIYDLIVANKVALGLADVWYGDQEMVPRSITACVEPGEVDRPLDGVPDLVLNTFTVYVIIYHTRVEDVQAIRRECDLAAEAIEDFLHTNLQLLDVSNTPGTDLVTHGWVTNNMSGYTTKQNRLIRSARLTWQGKAKTSLRFGP